MATITKRKSGWSVQIRRKGSQPEYRTLPTKAAAEKWARDRESEIDRGDAPVDRKALLSTTLGALSWCGFLMCIRTRNDVALAASGRG